MGIVPDARRPGSGPAASVISPKQRGATGFPRERRYMRYHKPFS
jgi:hypothetical protein